MTVDERREQLLDWMRLRPAYSLRTIFRLTPLSLYRDFRVLESDLRVLSREGRVHAVEGFSPRRWSIVRTFETV